MDINWVEFLDAKLLFLVAFVYVVGMFLKTMPKLDNAFIPFILWVLAIVVTATFYLIEGEMSTTNILFNALIQGTFIAGITVFANQLIKQATTIK